MTLSALILTLLPNQKIAVRFNTESVYKEIPCEKLDNIKFGDIHRLLDWEIALVEVKQDNSIVIILDTPEYAQPDWLLGKVDDDWYPVDYDEYEDWDFEDDEDWDCSDDEDEEENGNLIEADGQELTKEDHYKLYQKCINMIQELQSELIKDMKKK